MYSLPGCAFPGDVSPLTRCRSAHHHASTIRVLGTLRESEREARPHELLARRVRSNVEQHGVIYTPAAELEDLGDVDELIARHNRLLPPTERHAPRKLAHEHGHVFIVGYQNDTVSIIDKLREISVSGVPQHSSDVQAWIGANPAAIDDPLKAVALTELFEHSKVALVYGAAGTGKSTMMNHIANYFEDARKLFLAHTNPAVDNLKRRVQAPNAEFSTINKHVRNSTSFDATYDVLVIDECSTVSNASLLDVLREDFLRSARTRWRRLPDRVDRVWQLVQHHPVVHPERICLRTHRALQDHRPGPSHAVGQSAEAWTTTSKSRFPKMDTRRFWESHSFNIEATTRSCSALTMTACTELTTSTASCRRATQSTCGLERVYVQGRRSRAFQRV